MGIEAQPSSRLAMYFRCLLGNVWDELRREAWCLRDACGIVCAVYVTHASIRSRSQTGVSFCFPGLGAGDPGYLVLPPFHYSFSDSGGLLVSSQLLSVVAAFTLPFLARPPHVSACTASVNCRAKLCTRKRS